MEKIRILNIFPYAYKIIAKSKNFEYRKLIIKNYIIIYKINLKEKEVNILHIYNQKQKIKKKNTFKFKIFIRTINKLVLILPLPE